MVVMETSSIRVPLLLVSLIVLGSNISPFLLLAQCEGTNADPAGQLADSLHDAFRKNAGIDYLYRLYDSLSCVHQDNYGKTLLENITKPAVDRLNSTMKFLQDLERNLQQIASNSRRPNVSYCCQENATSFDERVLSSVDLKQGCTISESYQGTDGDLTFNSEVLSGFQKNFNKSSLVSWQYYGSINGEYLQYPSNQRHCDGTSSKFDPRFKSWYVESASPVKKNIVIIIDQSSSMRKEGKMEMAKDAAITVLDTLSPQDNVGVIAFSWGAVVPSGCFGSTVAVGIPTNLKILKDWIKKLVARGPTNYGPAFRQAFFMFHNVTKRQEISDRRNVVLFLTDGDPTDIDSSIDREIQNGQTMMNYTVQINTYAFGEKLTSRGLRRLRKISSSNSGVSQEIKSQNGSELRRLMGSYYTSINSSYEQKPRLSLPFMNSRLGLTVTMSSAVLRNGFFTGVVAVDLPIQRLFPEILQLSSTLFVYAILIDRQGRVILHPSLPAPTDVTSRRSFLPLSFFEPTLPFDVLQDITSGRSGKGIFEASFPLPLGNHPSDGARLLQTNATYMWSPVGENDYYIVCVVANDQSLTRNLKSFASSSPLSESFYHRLDLSWNAAVSRPRDICTWKNTLLAPASSTVKIAPDAFRDRSEYIHSTETLKDLQGIQQFFDDRHRPPQKKYKGLSEAVREEVQLTSKLEEIWKKEETLNPNLIQWRFVGTHQGVLRVYPGTRFQKTYSHKRQPWFMRAVSSPTKLIISATNSSYQQNTIMVSLSKAVRKIRCDKQGMEVLAVLGIEMTESAFLKIINDKVGLYDDSTMDWYLIDSSGYVLFNLSNQETQVEANHLTSVFPWLANELIRRDRTLKVSWCNNYRQHSVQMFYEMLDFSKNSSNNSFPCRQYKMNIVPGTTLFLLGLPPRSVHQCTESSLTPQEGCSCSKFCIVCSDDASLTCQCPCECLMRYDKCQNSVTRLWTSTPCPLPPPSLYDTDMEQAIFEGALSSVRKCSRDCLTILNRTACEKTTDCYWCSNAAIPSCNSECRTNQSLSMVALFPCNDLVNLTAGQQASFKLIFIEKLRQLVHTLTSQSLQILKLKKGTIAFKLHATTMSSDLDTTKRNIQRAVNQGKVVFGPAVDLPDIFTARSPKQYTDLVITLSMEKSLPQRPQDIKSALQSILERILGKSLVSLIRQFSVNKASVKFSLSNEGHIYLYPLKPFKDRLEKAVKLREISFQVPTKDAVNTAVNMSTIKTFHSLCRTTTPSEASTTYSTTTQKITTYFWTSQKITTYVTSSQKGTTYFTASQKGTTYFAASREKDTTYFTNNRQSTQPKETSSSSTTGKSSMVTPTEKERDLKPGLTPIEICVIATVSIVGAFALFCLFFFLFRARKRRPRSTSQVSPETDEADERRSVISEIPEIDTNLNIVVNRAYFVHEELKTYRSHVGSRERDSEMTSPKNITQGAWF